MHQTGLYFRTGARVFRALKTNAPKLIPSKLRLFLHGQLKFTLNLWCSLNSVGILLKSDELNASNFKLQTSNFKLQTSNFKLQAANGPNGPNGQSPRLKHQPGYVKTCGPAKAPSAAGWGQFEAEQSGQICTAGFRRPRRLNVLCDSFRETAPFTSPLTFPRARQSTRPCPHWPTNAGAQTGLKSRAA